MERYIKKTVRDEWMVRDLVALGVCCEVKIRKSEQGEVKETNDKADGDDDLLDSESNIFFSPFISNAIYRS